jgi:hypothetical protein
LIEYEADLYVIQECENPDFISNKKDEYKLLTKNCVWTGNNKNKGLGVFAIDSYSINKMNWNNRYRGRELQWFLPITFDNKYKIIAVWNHHADAEAFPYIGQFWLYLQNNKEFFANSIICGDFNSNSIWDKWDRWWNHSDCVKELYELGIYSVYHHIHGVDQGAEPQKTFYLHRNPEKGYHIDYFFADSKFVQNGQNRLEFGQFAFWKEFSDHVPILWEF